jgi:hypothetical protein
MFPRGHSRACWLFSFTFMFSFFSFTNDGRVYFIFSMWRMKLPVFPWFNEKCACIWICCFVCEYERKELYPIPLLVACPLVIVSCQSWLSRP